MSRNNKSVATNDEIFKACSANLETVARIDEIVERVRKAYSKPLKPKPLPEKTLGSGPKDITNLD